MQDTDNVGEIPQNELEPSDMYDKLVEQAINIAQPKLWDAEELLGEDDEVVAEPVVEKETTPNPEDEAIARVTAREAALAAKEKELETKLSEYKKTTSNPDVVNLADIRKLAETNVSGVLDKFGLDKDHIMDVLIAEKLGDKAPPQLKEKLKDYSLRKEIEAIRSERDNERRLNEARSYYQKVSDEARSYVTTGLDEKVAPTVLKAVKADPDLVHGLVLSEINRDAQEKMARGETDGQLLTHAEAVSNLEKLFSKIAAAVKNEEVAKTTSTKVTTKTTPPITRPKESNKPVDEIAELEKKGLDSALRTFYKEEAKRTGRQR
jgi:hypothetical protein